MKARFYFWVVLSIIVALPVVLLFNDDESKFYINLIGFAYAYLYYNIYFLRIVPKDIQDKICDEE